MTAHVENSEMAVEDVMAAVEDVPDRASGPAAAALVAAGVGSFVLGLLVVIAEIGGHDAATGNTGSIFAQVRTFLDFAKNYGLGSGVGALSGKVILSVLAYLISWGVFFLLWRGKDVSIRRAFIATLVLVGLGFALTFPPIFYFLAGE